MRKKLLALLLPITVYCLTSSAQTVDWSSQIASIIYDNCSSCHHHGGIAPFPLMNYNDAVDNAFSIQTAVNAGIMPPWPADPDYRHFAYEAVLDDAEITAINQWVNDGTPAGNLNLAPAPPQFSNTGSMLEWIDYTVAIEPYTLQYNTDEYRWFAMANPFTDTVYVHKIEVIPGIDSIIHHADISYDVTGHTMQNDLEDPLPGFNSSSGWPTYSYYMNAWQPGGNIVSYPENWGIAVPPGSDFVFEIHYGPGGQGLIDSTVMNLQFVTNTSDVRKIKVQWILYDSSPCLTDGPLVIPANSVKTFHQKSSPMPVDRSFISICPHQHHLGKSYRVWFETSEGDSVPLIDIPQWNFYWQKYYTFQQVQKIPQGARIRSEATYDNTTNNPDNPNNPPITVSSGETTMDEMLLCYFIYADYEPGDEDIVLDSTLIATGMPVSYTTEQSVWKAYPNPFSSTIHFSSIENPGSTIHFSLTDVFGRRVDENYYGPGSSFVYQTDVLPSGIYFFRVEVDGKSSQGMVIRN